MSPIRNRIKLHLFVDRSSVEVFGNEGERVITSLIFPSSESRGVEIYANNGNVKLIALGIYTIQASRLAFEHHGFPTNPWDNGVHRWVIGSVRSLSTGSWREQGYPFYSSAMTYSKRIWIDPSAASATLKLNSWQGTVASVLVNGKIIGLIGLDRSNKLDLSTYVVKGTNNEIAVRLSL